MVQESPDSQNIVQLVIQTGAQRYHVSSHRYLSIKNDTEIANGVIRWNRLVANFE